MKALLMLLLALTAVAATAQEPEPGQHVEPPPGWSCSPTGAGDHHCDCKHMGDPATSCETALETSACKVWCFKEHCACPIVGCDMEKK